MHSRSFFSVFLCVAGALATKQRPDSEKSLYDHEGHHGQFPFSYEHKHHIEVIGSEEKTIYEILQDNDIFSRLAAVVDISDEVVELLDDPNMQLTFFAAPNIVFRGPDERRGDHPPKDRPREDRFKHAPLDHHGRAEPDRHGRHSKDQEHGGELLHLRAGESHKHHKHRPEITYQEPRALGDTVKRVEEMVKSLSDSEGAEDPRIQGLTGVIERQAHGLLMYHTVPEVLDVAQLLERSTLPSNQTMKDGSLDWTPLRLSVEVKKHDPQHPIVIDGVASIVQGDIKAKNGIIHVISSSVQPPPSVFQQAFLNPAIFSYATSALQRVNLLEDVELRHVQDPDGGHGETKGAFAVTFFAPTNHAFTRLPKKLQQYLFSPAGPGGGERALRKLLKLHIVPDYVLHTDWLHNVTTRSNDSTTFEDLKKMPHQCEEMTRGLDCDEEASTTDSLIYCFDATLPTLVKDFTLHAAVAKSSHESSISDHSITKTRFSIEGHHVVVGDLIARNGAMHVVNRLFNPRPYIRGDVGPRTREQDDQDWEEWEDWLPQWAKYD